MPMKNPKLILPGKNIFLRYPQVEDCEEFVALNKASAKFHRNLANPPKDEKVFKEFLTRNAFEENECFLICQKTDEKICGAINLTQIFRARFQNAYLGYYLGQKFAGKGYMKEAIALILRFAFDELKLHRVEANVQPHNTASISVLERNGFSKEGFSPKYLKIGGRWRDHERWAIIKENWKGKGKN